MTTTAEEHLTTGWEPDLDLDDSLLRRALFCWAEVCELFSVNAGGKTATNAAFAISDYRRPSGLFNSAVLLQPPDPSTFDEVLAEIERFFAGGSGEALLWSAWPTPDLSRRGWHLYGHPPLMVRPPADLHRPPRAPSVPVASVVDGAGLAAWERIAVEGYPLEELIPLVPGSFAHPALLDDDRLQFTIGTDHDRPASIGSLFVNPGIAFFLLAVTQPATRRRGHWLAHAVARLRAAPSVWAAGVFSDVSRAPHALSALSPCSDSRSGSCPGASDRSRRAATRRKMMTHTEIMSSGSDYARPELLAEPDWLWAQGSRSDLRVVDCGELTPTWQPNNAGTADAYRQGHIPHAVPLPVHNWLKDPAKPLHVIRPERLRA